MIYFTSDTHFCHRRILEFEPRRLSWCTDLDSMNRTIIQDWIQFKEDDTLFILGDFMFDKKNNYQYISNLLEPVKCNLALILGNHDRGLDQDFMTQHFTLVDNYYETYYNGVKLVMCHYPVVEWNDNHGGTESIMIHGHLHSKPCRYYHPRLINVGVDALPGRFISAPDLIEEARSRVRDE